MKPILAARFVALKCWAVATLAVACSGGTASQTVPPAGSADEPWEKLPQRAQVVSRADLWAVKGSEAKGPAGAEWTARAGRLRERIWRLEGRAPDGLEALELLEVAGRADWQGACRAALGRALLEAEIRSDPGLAFRNVYRLKQRETNKPCGQSMALALNVLAAYQPGPGELARLVDSKAPKENAPGPVVVPPSQVVLPRGQLARQGTISRVERYGAKESARVVVFMTAPLSYKVGVLEAQAGRGPRLYLDIEGARYGGAGSFDVGGLVERVRLGAQGNGTRLVLDLSKPVFHRVFYLPEPFRLIIDVSESAPGTTSRVGQRSVRRVVLDPGHGGHDPGAVGPAGLREKDVTLDIAHRAAPLLARELSISTLLTRDTDQFVPLPERTARANAFQADLFVSIHCNASEQPGGSGIMTFVLDESKDALASQIAARENAASQAAGAELATVMSRVLGVGSVAESLRFAELLQRAAMASVRERYPTVRDQGVKRAGFYVLAGAQMPAVLYEASFISNPGGEVRLNTGDFRQKMADAIVNAVRAYREGL